jgi:SpoVK/Ycf46/Vps4 family AAA+-type ATPase
VVVIAACNDAARLDPALVRAGRLDRHIAIPLPDMPALTGIFRSHLGAELVMGSTADRIKDIGPQPQSFDIERATKENTMEMPDAKIEKQTDVLVRITTTNICGSDLHMYEGRTDMESGRILGHENLGEVIVIGKAVDRVKVGDMVCLPFNIGCGFCANCGRE